MRDVAKLMTKLGADEEGAALIEYTVLLGILLIAVITTIGLVANWVSNKWHNLQANLP
jgi:pilus assembly protein Flp/PilA